MKTCIKYYVLGIMGILLLYIIHTTNYIIPTVYAEVKLREKFGFGDIQSLGQATSKLVGPAFSLAAAIVVIYFLLGAFKYMRAEANKEEIEGARNMIIHAIIGFIILMFVFFILPFFLSSLFRITDFRIF